MRRHEPQLGRARTIRRRNEADRRVATMGGEKQCARHARRSQHEVAAVAARKTDAADRELRSCVVCERYCLRRGAGAERLGGEIDPVGRGIGRQIKTRRIVHEAGQCDIGRGRRRIRLQRKGPETLVFPERPHCEVETATCVRKQCNWHRACSRDGEVRGVGAADRHAGNRKRAVPSIGHEQRLDTAGDVRNDVAKRNGGAAESGDRSGERRGGRCGQKRRECRDQQPAGHFHWRAFDLHRALPKGIVQSRIRTTHLWHAVNRYR